MYKHLASQHNKSKTEYLKMSKAIRNNAFIDEKENEAEETPPKLHFVKARPPEEAMQVDFLSMFNNSNLSIVSLFK